MDEKIDKEVEAKMEKTLSALKTDFNKVRTGRHPQPSLMISELIIMEHPPLFTKWQHWQPQNPG